jgi:tryptophan 2,3-dioxygenase
MNLQDCIDNRRWATSLLNEVEQALKKQRSEELVKQYWYLKEWIEKFDKLISHFTCWNENHVVYQDGLKRLKELSMAL